MKKIIAILLLMATVLLACSCNSKNESVDGTDATEAKTDEQPTEKPTQAVTDKPLLATDMLLSDEAKPVRIVYSDGYKGEANKVFDKLVALDSNFKIGKYAATLDSTAEEGSLEIVIGDTNRAATEEAKKLITESGCIYSVYVSDKAIAVYAPDAEGVKAATDKIVAKLAKKGSAVIYDASAGSYTGEYEKTNLLQTLVKAAEKNGLPVYRISVYDANGLQTETVNASNPCQNCYSVTKLYCVTAIGMLFDEGKIKTSDTIGSIFAEELAEYGIDPTAWNKVTIHDVLRHRAGFEHGFLDIDVEDSTKFSSQDFLKIVLSEPLVYEPGEKSVYTDAAFYLISRVVTKISGEKLDDFLAKRLFNLTDCREFAFATCPQGYPIGATGLYIRSADVAKLGHIYLNGGKYGEHQIISQEWIDKVIDNGYELHRSGAGYSKGGMRGQNIYINFDKGVAVAWHSYDPGDENGPLSDALHSFFEN